VRLCGASTADWIDRAKAFGDEQAGAHALAFEQCVGADRGAVAEVRDVVRPHALADQRLDAFEDRPRRIIGRRRHLRDRHFSGFFVQIDEI
jgi:hypothetical protein